MWLFLEVRTLLPDQGNKEKIERVMNSIELALLDRISQSLPFRLRPLLNSNSAGSGVLERRLGSAREPVLTKFPSFAVKQVPILFGWLS